MTDFKDWIGRQSETQDTVTDMLARQFRATMDGVPSSDEYLAGLQWCLAPEIFPPADLGRDGHPRTGLTLPDLGLPRRMWAGGTISYSQGLRVDETVTKRTVISDITFKEGRSGKLGFVRLDHAYLCDGQPRITETQNIVYRQDPEAGSQPPKPTQAEIWTPIRAFEITPTSTLLFRYSALTFNGHRVHYDHNYATEVEGYAGLLVHGPLQSNWMQCLATEILGHLPKDFSYRGLSPLVCGRVAVVEAQKIEGKLKLRVRDKEANIVTMQAQAS